MLLCIDRNRGSMSISIVNKVQQKQHIASTLQGLPASQLRRMIEDHRYFYHWMLSGALIDPLVEWLCIKLFERV